MARENRSNRLIYILLGIVGALIVFVVVGNKAGWIGGPDETEVEVSEVKKTTIVEKVSASGMIQPEYEVKISPDVSGEIIELHVEEGDSVQTGQLLLKIRPDIYQSSLERAKANLNQQRANLAEAKARVARAEAQLVRSENEFKRNKDLHDQKVLSDADFEVSQANYKVAQNDLISAKESEKAAQYIVASSQASVKEATENLRFTIITAPIKGIVSKLSVELGERVVGTAQMSGTEMLRIADLTKMEARVDVNENDIIKVTEGDTAIIDVDSYSHTGKKFKGVVRLIANTANDKSSADAVTEFEVRIKVLNDSYKDLMENKDIVSPFRPGMTASVDIITNVKDNVLAIPLASVTTRSPGADLKGPDGGRERRGPEEFDDSEEGTTKAKKKDEIKEVVFLFEDGKAKMTEVKTGISDFENIEILGDSIKEGQKIISGPFVEVSKRLKDGDLVKTKETKEFKKTE